jgi:hypothetical protein
MIIASRAAALAAAFSLWACTQAPPRDPPADRPPALDPVVDPIVDPVVDPVVSAAPEALTDEAAAFTTRRFLAPSPELLKAALTNDPDIMRDAVIATASTCQAASTCPAQFGSCGSWSTPSLCSETCGAPLCVCRPIRQCEGEPPEPRGTDTFNSFRVCFDPSHNACTEWSSTTSTFCGC